MTACQKINQGSLCGTHRRDVFECVAKLREELDDIRQRVYVARAASNQALWSVEEQIQRDLK